MDDVVRRIDPPVPVLVRHEDDRWYAGTQDGWVRWADGSWQASVTNTVAGEARYVRAMPAERVRRAEG